jgi:acetyl-CoA acetyltransferase
MTSRSTPRYQAEIPYGAYWSTPFARWQGSFAGLHSIEFAAWVAKRELARRRIDPKVFDYGVLGFSVPQKHSFYGAPWLMGLVGAGQVGGPTLMQACATGVRTLLAGVQEIESGLATTALVLNADRTSNGPHLYYPNPRGPGGTGAAEDWVMDNFACDPLGPHAMIATAENVARRHDISTAEQHEVVLQREAQYAQALADGAAFLRRFITLPFEVPAPNFKKTVATLEGDEGLTRSTPEGLAALKPVTPGGTVTYGGQTHPADGNAAIVVTTRARARELSREPKIAVRIRGFGLARAELAHMPEATVPAAAQALAQAGIRVANLAIVKTHNPFAVNDVYFSRQTGVDWRTMNPYGCSLVWGHPQAPMGTRSIIELIEALAMRGGGTGLFTGCAAGDTAMAVVIEVGDA